jgi:hypothetical protein
MCSLSSHGAGGGSSIGPETCCSHISTAPSIRVMSERALVLGGGGAASSALELRQRMGALALEIDVNAGCAAAMATTLPERGAQVGRPPMRRVRSSAVQRT